jgi:hypothetical protein
LPPPEKPPLRDELELVERPKPPEELGLLVVVEVDGLLDDVLDEPPNARCDWVGLEMAFALAAIFSAFGETAGWEMTGLDDLLTDEPAVRELMVPV